MVLKSQAEKNGNLLSVFFDLAPKAPTLHQKKIRSTQIGTQKKWNPATTPITVWLAAIWVNTIKRKTTLAKEKASGIMIWQLQGDAGGAHSLLQAINEVGYGGK